MTIKELCNIADTVRSFARIQYAGACLRVTGGREGPITDPYGFTEIRVHRFLQNGEYHVFTLHMGLSTFLTVNGRNFDFFDNTFLQQLFFELTGVDPRKVEKLNARIHGPYDRCPNCGNKNLEYHDGFAGEQMQVCPHTSGCGNMLWSEDPTPYVI